MADEEQLVSSGTRGNQWTESRQRKDPTLYDEWLNEEKFAQPVRSPRRDSSMPVHRGDTAANPTTLASSTIRSVTPGQSGDENDMVSGAGTRSSGRHRSAFFDQTYSPHNSSTSNTTDPASPVALPGRRRRLVKLEKKERASDRAQEARVASHSPPSSRNGSSVAEMLAQRIKPTDDDSNNGGRQQRFATSAFEDRARRRLTIESSTRPRTRTLDEHPRAALPAHVFTQRSRIGSVNLPSSPPTTADAPNLLSSFFQESTPNMRRSSAPPVEDIITQSPSTARTSQAKRILSLMRTLRGRMNGTVDHRQHTESPWVQIYCYIQEDTAALMYEPKVGDTTHRILISNLRGCTVRPRVENDTAYLEINVPGADQDLHIKPSTQTDFDGWYAAFLYWLDPNQESNLDQVQRPSSPSAQAPSTEQAPDLPPRRSSRGPQDREENTNSGRTKSDRRRSDLHSLKEAPVIKIGKMVYWETSADSGSAAGTLPVNSSSRPATRRTKSIRSRRWRRISGQLRENGELKLHSDADNTLISVVQLSQLSRCAIQRLDPTVLEVDFCIAIYPQYTSNPTDPQAGLIRPIFLSLEGRVLYEVWFVLLRAFTIPQLYGPRSATVDGAEDGEDGTNPDLEDLLATSTLDMFRMERTLSIRVVEAKIYPTTTSNTGEPSAISGGHVKGTAKPEQHGYYAEVLLDSESRGKTIVKFEGLSPLWGESFEFLDLPPVLNSASIVIKRRSADNGLDRYTHDGRRPPDPHASLLEQQGGLTGFTSDASCGKVEIYLQELEEGKETEKWWPAINSHNQRIGEVLIKAQAEEGVILMARDYQPLAELLHRFSNGLTLQIAQMVPNELRRVSACLLDIFQVSGRACDWLMSLIEEEIDGIHKETLAARSRFNKRSGSDSGNAESFASGTTNSERELLVRDMNKNAALEANLLFRGNTLLTKALDSHMRRVGKEFLDESLAAKLKEINDKDPECEVDPNRVPNQQDLDRNWRRLLLFTQEIWNAICNARQKCPIELRLIFKHIRACAEDRYGDFLRTVRYSSVSGFLFLRFFCPAILNPKLFGILNDEIRPRARRAFVLIAKSLQTLANLASFGTKETWMEPMNAFLTQHRENFKSLIDDICYVPTPLLASVSHGTSSAQAAAYAAGVVSAETHLSYTTPMTIMQRLPPTSREGFPSLPYLIDQARAYADLVQVWLEATTRIPRATERTSLPQQAIQLMTAIQSSEGDLLSFHETCTSLHNRTQECLSRAERAERPHSAVSFQWDELIDQLTPSNGDGPAENPIGHISFENLAERIASDPAIATSSVLPAIPSGTTREWRTTDDEDEEYERHATRLYDPTPPTGASAATSATALDLLNQVVRERPWSAGKAAALRDSLRKARSHSRGSGSPARPISAGNSLISSNANSDTEQTTALPTYDREIRQRGVQHWGDSKMDQSGAGSGSDGPARPRDRDSDREKGRKKSKTPLVSALRKTRQKQQENGGVGSGSAASSTSNGRGVLRGGSANFL